MLKGTLHHEVHELHKKYGPVVRIAPNELSYIDAQAWKDIYLSRPGHTPIPKNPTWNKQASTGIFSLDENLHAQSRRALNPSFTAKSIDERSPLIEEYVNLMIAKLKEQIAVGSGRAVINIIDWFDFITFDLLGEFAFSESFDCVKSGKAHPWVSITLGFAKSLGLMASVNFFSPLDKLFEYIIPKDVLRKAEYHKELTNKKIQQRIEKSESAATSDYIGIITEFFSKKGVTMSADDLTNDMVAIVVAGSDTTSTTLSATMSFLLQEKNARVLHKLVGEIRSSFENEEQITVSSASKLEYLIAVIKEGLRLAPQASMGIPRTMPDKGDTICDQWVPGGVSVHLCKPAKEP